MPATLQLIRHATMLLTVSGKRILVDPYLAEKGTQPPVPISANRRRNPLVSLPIPADDLNNLDAVLLTHTHFDHFDEAAKSFFPKGSLIFCQPTDEPKLRRDGFTNIKPVVEKMEWGGISISRYDAHHGYGLIGYLMGKCSSYMIESNGLTAFITGDAVLDEALHANLMVCKPNVVVANAGCASFRIGRPITMGASDMVRILDLLPQAKIIAVHMDTVNHCKHTRAYLNEYLKLHNLSGKIYVPQNGEAMTVWDS